MKPYWVLVILFIPLCMFFFAWSQIVDGSLYVGIVLSISYFLYFFFWGLKQSKKGEYQQNYLFSLSTTIYVSILSFCISFLIMRSLIIKIKSFIIVYFMVLLVIQLYVLIRTLSLRSTKKQKRIDPLVITLLVIATFFCSGIVFAIIYGIHDRYELKNNLEASLKFTQNTHFEKEVHSVDSLTVYFEDAKAELSYYSDRLKIDRLAQDIAAELTKQARILVEIKAYADKRPLYKPNAMYASNFELTTERANRIKSNLIYSITEYMRKNSRLPIDNLEFVETRYSSEQAHHPLNLRDKKVDIVVLAEKGVEQYGSNQWYDYFYFSYLTIITASTGTIIPVTKGLKLIVLFENLYGVLFLSFLLTLVVDYCGKEKNLIATNGEHNE